MDLYIPYYDAEKGLKPKASKLERRNEEKTKISSEINKRKSTTNQNKPQNSRAAIPKVTDIGQFVYGTYTAIF